LNKEEYRLAEAIEVIQEVLDSGADFSLYPKGTSMLPLIVQGKDAVTIKKSNGTDAKCHDIAFYRRDNGDFVLHRIMKVCHDGTFVMCGDNQTYFERGVRPDQIIATVCGISKDGEQLNMMGMRYRTYVFWWTKMPVRRFCMLCRKIKVKLIKILRGKSKNTVD